MVMGRLAGTTSYPPPAPGTATVVFPHLPESWSNPSHDLVVPLLSGGCLVRVGPGEGVPAAWALGLAAAAFLMVLVAAVAARPARASLPPGGTAAASSLPGFQHGMTSPCGMAASIRSTARTSRPPPSVLTISRSLQTNRFTSGLAIPPPPKRLSSK